MKKTILILLASALLLGGCEQTPADGKVEPRQDTAVSTTSEKQQPEPPAPPLSEDFQTSPKISLFPRVGPVRPTKEDERYPFWLTYLDHLKRTSGVTNNKVEANRAFTMRSINGVDSVGWFTPVAVEPATRYRVGASFKADLPDGATCGIGLIEFDRFLWIGDQFTQQQLNEHQRATTILVNLSGKFSWQAQTAEFTTGSDTRMVHLLFFRDGADGKEPVLLDDLKIEKVGS